MEVLAYADGQVVEICEGEGGWRRGCLRPGHLRRRRRALRNPAPVAGEPEEPLRPDRIGASGRGKGGRPGCRRRGPGPRAPAARLTTSEEAISCTEEIGPIVIGTEGSARWSWPVCVIQTPLLRPHRQGEGVDPDLLQVESVASLRVVEVTFEDGSQEGGPATNVEPEDYIAHHPS